MFRRISASIVTAALMLCLSLVCTSQAMARTAQASPSSKFSYTGKMPSLIKQDLALDKVLTKKQRRELALDKKAAKSCTAKYCDVVIIDDGVNPGLRIAGLMLNIFLPFAIGSWIVGDRLGAYFGTSAQIAGIALFVLGAAMAGTQLGMVGLTLAIVGGVLFAAGWILPMITVMLFQRRRYRGRYYRRRYYRRRYYRRRRYRRYHSPSHIHSASMSKAFATTATVKGMAFQF